MEVNELDNLDKVKPSRKKYKKIILITVLCVLSVFIVFTSIFIINVKKNVDKMIITHPVTSVENPIVLDTPEIKAVDYKELYILVLGLDYREEHAALLTDSIMVLHIIPKQPTIKLLSIPRDLLVENSRQQYVKINSIFSEGIYSSKRLIAKDSSMLIGETVSLGSEDVDKSVLSGGMTHTKNKIDELLDININYTVIVNFDTIISLVDEVGGIEIDVKRTMRYRPTNLYLESGLQTLSGEQALGYARFRQDDRGSRYYSSDFERGLQQQEVVKALAEKITSWKNVSKVLKLLEIISTNVQTDLDYSTLYTLIKDYYGMFNADSFASIPFPEYYTSTGDVTIPDDALSELRADFQSLEERAEEPIN